MKEQGWINNEGEGSRKKKHCEIVLKRKYLRARCFSNFGEAQQQQERSTLLPVAEKAVARVDNGCADARRLNVCVHAPAGGSPVTICCSHVNSGPSSPDLPLSQLWALISLGTFHKIQVSEWVRQWYVQVYTYTHTDAQTWVIKDKNQK